MRRELALGIKEYLLWVAVLTLALFPASSALALPDPDPLYAGYNHRRARWGVSAFIYMMDADVPWHWNWENRYSEWDCIVLDYSPAYWLQTGYRKWWWGNREFYVEKKDENNHKLWPVDGVPQAGHTYRYRIRNLQYTEPDPYPDIHDYRVTIREGSQTLHSGTYWLDPYEPCDLQAKIESQDARIHIDGSHFSGLRYPSGGSWLLWDRHFGKADPPYKIDEVSHYEFYASGGL